MDFGNKWWIKTAILFFCVTIMHCNALFANWEFDTTYGWYYIDEHGVIAKNTIVRKDSLKFYVDDTGYVYKEGMVTFNNDVTYYFNYFGAMATNCWVKISSDLVKEKTDPIPEYYYYYFGEDGKAIRGMTNKPRFYKLDGKTYLFNEYGQLLIGWIREDGSIIDPEEYEHPYEEAYYYSNNEGELVSGWIRAENSYSDAEYLEDNRYLWFYFEPKTYKKRGYGKIEEKNIGSSHYIFSDKGYIYTDFIAYSLDNTRREEYYGDKKGGRKYKAQWAWTLPPEDGTYSEEEKSEKHWMFMEKSGKPVKNELRKINKKYYSFNEKGIMQTGIVAYLDGTILFVVDMEETSAEDIVKKGKYTYKKNGETYYFYDTVGYDIYGDQHYLAGSDWVEPEYGIRIIFYGTMSKEINTRRNFVNTGRYSELDVAGRCPYNRNIRYLYFKDDGSMVNGREKVHFKDGEYYFACNISGHYMNGRKNKYYYDGIELRADKEIGYGIYTVEKSGPQTMQKNSYALTYAPLSYNDPLHIPDMYKHYYQKLNDSESLYKVLNPEGKIVKGRKTAYKDKQGRYWYIEPNGDWLYGLFNTKIRKSKSKYLPMRTLIDKNSCPEVLKSGTLQQKLTYLREYDLVQGKYVIDMLFDEDFKDAYTFMHAGEIKDIKVEEVKDCPDKLRFSILYEGMLYWSMYGNRMNYIPFGMMDENDDTATFFRETNDFEIIPDDNDLFVNCCWDDYDSCDFMCKTDSDGVRHVDYLS